MTDAEQRGFVKVMKGPVAVARALVGVCDAAAEFDVIGIEGEKKPELLDGLSVTPLSEQLLGMLELGLCHRPNFRGWSRLKTTAITDEPALGSVQSPR